MTKDEAVIQSVPQTGNFEQLFAAEQRWRHAHGVSDQTVGAAEKFHDEPEVAAGNFTESPRVTFANEDCVGLAFSGGGIRSATFNLGVLQGLHRLKILAHFDYLSTVSGGGYIGAWWSAWLARRTPTPAGDDPFPKASGTAEPAEVRHLREFGNFLAPRIGFFQSETWGAVLAVLSAMLPALLVALAFIAVGELLWVAAAMATLPWEPWRAMTAVILMALVVEWLCERRWAGRGKAEDAAFPTRWWVGTAIVTIVAGGCVWWAIQRSGLLGQIRNLWPIEGIDPLGGDFVFSKHLLHTPLTWAGTALLLFIPRILILRFFRGDDGTTADVEQPAPAAAAGTVRAILQRPKAMAVSWRWRIRRAFQGSTLRAQVSTIDRVLQRLLAAATLWSIIAGIWIAGAFLAREYGQATAAGAVLSGGAFALLRNWFINQLSGPREGGMLETLKSLAPQLLALVALLLTAMCIASVLIFGLYRWHNTFYVIALLSALGIIGFAAAFFDPALVSMHAFYRNRLARAYLGASNPNALQQDAGTNRFIDVRIGDDIKMRALLPTGTGIKRGPLHLICCAANDVGGDQLSNLTRASRSAVLSPLGFQIGNHWRPWNNQPSDSPTCIDRLTLSSAITASAAAFNSNMGSLSANLGTVVCFLMSALNLRLGLWLPHPCSDTDDLGWFPGALFLREMFGLTECGMTRIRVGDKEVEAPRSRYVHLSDGAHFENLALYELVRRHCRYILLSDCGADAEIAFDDFGNAVRRIREDFGVEIEIDLGPLRPNEAEGRLSRQHAVVGNIIYDREKNDTGVLVYFKPTITGDEPGDVAQYRTRNAQFPHEGTGDQFYDEAQWESYRRLGEHALLAVFGFLERIRKTSKECTPEDIFLGVRREWYPAPADLADRLAQTSGRVAELEQRLRTDASPRLQREIFPELVEMSPKRSQRAKAVPSFDELHTDLVAMLAMAHAMEDVWLSCYLDTHWNHPMNVGWVNLFQRWAYTPTFRFWWPLMKTRHSAQFRRFLEERFDLDDLDYPPIPKTLGKCADTPPNGFAKTFWERARDLKQSRKPLAHEKDWKDKYYPFEIVLMQQSDGSTKSKEIKLQVAIARVEKKGDIVQWGSNDLYVPPGLWGSGLGGTFLRKLLAELTSRAGTICRVKLQPPGELETTAKDGKALQRTDIAGRQAQADLIAFYKGAGFRLEKCENEKGDEGDWMVYTAPRKKA